MSAPDVAVLAFCMGVVTYLTRWLPLFFLSRRPLPAWFGEWLELVPAAILSALILPELLLAPQTQSFTLLQPKLLVSIPTFYFALKTRSMAGSVLFGMLLFWIAQQIL